VKHEKVSRAAGIQDEGQVPDSVKRGIFFCTSTTSLSPSLHAMPKTDRTKKAQAVAKDNIAPVPQKARAKATKKKGEHHDFC
jgi:hypothetical protein